MKIKREKKRKRKKRKEKTSKEESKERIVEGGRRLSISSANCRIGRP